jgi:hypothetical protein
VRHYTGEPGPALPGQRALGEVQRSRVELRYTVAVHTVAVHTVAVRPLQEDRRRSAASTPKDKIVAIELAAPSAIKRMAASCFDCRGEPEPGSA